MRYDVIVLGLGAMGSAAAYHLAKRGRHVLGIEQYTSPHDRGSTHGGSRIIRQAYWESPDYIPLVLRAYDLWRALEVEAGVQLLKITGGIIVGTPDCDLIRGSAGICADPLHPVRTAGSARGGTPLSGVPIVCEQTVISEFDFSGTCCPNTVYARTSMEPLEETELRFTLRSASWTGPLPKRAWRVITQRGRYEADHLVITAGPWTGSACGTCFGCGSHDRSSRDSATGWRGCVRAGEVSDLPVGSWRWSTVLRVSGDGWT